MFASVDLRVGRVVDAEPFPKARRPSLRVTVDFGPHVGVRVTVAQVATYPPASLVGRQVIGAINLGVRRIAGFDSEFLLLGAVQPDGVVSLLTPDDDVPAGTPVA